MAAIAPDYAGPNLPTLLGNAATPFLTLVAARVHALMGNEEFFVDPVVQLVKEVFLENGGKNPDALDFRAAVVNILNGFEYSVAISFDSVTEAAAEPTKAEIKLAASWMVHLIFVEVGSKEYQDQFALAVSVFFREFANLLTPHLLVIDQQFRNAGVPKASPPVSLGTKKTLSGGSPRWRGNLGNRLQEIVFGGRVCGAYDTRRTTLMRLYLTVESSPEVFVDKDISPAVYNAFVRNVISEPPASAAVFVAARDTRKVSLSKKRKAEEEENRRIVSIGGVLFGGKGLRGSRGEYVHFQPSSTVPGVKV